MVGAAAVLGGVTKMTGALYRLSLPFLFYDILTLLLFPLLCSSPSSLAVFLGDFAPFPRFQIFISLHLKFLYILL